MIKKLSIVFIVEGILSFLLAVLMYYTVGLSNAIFILTMPFELIGNGLRWLSLSSAAGNVAAFIMYVIISLIPLLYCIIRAIRRKLDKPDLLLPILSIYSFYLFYEFINPQLMFQRSPQMIADEEFLPMLKISFSFIFYTLLIAYLLLNMASHLSDVPSEDRLSGLCTQLSKILVVFSGFYTFLFMYSTSFELFMKIDKYVVENRSTINLYHLLINYVLDALPIIFSILTLLSGTALLSAMASDHMRENEYLAAKSMGIISRQAVYVTILCNIASNVIQFLLSDQLNDTDYNLDISLTPLIIAFIAMILSGYFKETKELYDDNNMII